MEAQMLWRCNYSDINETDHNFITSVWQTSRYSTLKSLSLNTSWNSCHLSWIRIVSRVTEWSEILSYSFTSCPLRSTTVLEQSKWTTKSQQLKIPSWSSLISNPVTSKHLAVNGPPWSFVLACLDSSMLESRRRNQSESIWQWRELISHAVFSCSACSGICGSGNGLDSHGLNDCQNARKRILARVSTATRDKTQKAM